MFALAQGQIYPPVVVPRAAVAAKRKFPLYREQHNGHANGHSSRVIAASASASGSGSKNGRCAAVTDRLLAVGSALANAVDYAWIGLRRPNTTRAPTSPQLILFYPSAPHPTSLNG
jgi:hypothetical protein